MRKQIARLSKAKREKAELEYQRMKPEDFDEAMVQAKPRRAEARSNTKPKSKGADKKRAA